MTTLFFGGDSTMSHFSVDLPHRPYNATTEERKAFDLQRKEDRAKLKALGWKEVYCQFKDKDPAAKIKAKAKADAIAAEWEAKTGLKFKVAEGCFL